MVDGIYEMDFDHLESIIDDAMQGIDLCNPHNPGGSSEKETLVRLADICAKHNILVIPMIHAEMAYPQYTHYPSPPYRIPPLPAA